MIETQSKRKSPKLEQRTLSGTDLTCDKYEWIDRLRGNLPLDMELILPVCSPQCSNLLQS
jgi:hypothetical protein